MKYLKVPNRRLAFVITGGGGNFEHYPISLAFPASSLNPTETPEGRSLAYFYS